MTVESARLDAPTSVPARHGDRRTVDALLIGYQDQGNLGMGYLAAVLHQHGYTAEFIDVRDGSDQIAKLVMSARPLVVGFSLIFQSYLPQFRSIAARLRAAGSRSHFTIGGHYPSLCPEEVLAQLPEIDSIARYEGELTLLELVARLAADEDWRDVPGLAYSVGGGMAESSPRALVTDLDALPHPFRPYEPEQIVGFRAMPLLASRGCARRCSFCSIHTFYRTAPGRVVRVRAADKVVAEMNDLFERRGVRVFLFQDDDFPLWGRAGRKWVDELTERLDDSGLGRRVIWKVSCRGEYVEPELFAKLRDAGMFMVYMGIESGVEAGLAVLHKQMTAQQNLSAVQTLKDLGVTFSYGFMLFDPSSTFDSVHENVQFLRKIVGDGSAAALFCRMLPYGGTPIRDQLASEGRLRGDVTHPDYDFLDGRLNEYHLLLDRAAAFWIHNDGISHQINWAWTELETARRLVPGLTGCGEYRGALRQVTADSNEALFRLVEESLPAFQGGDRGSLDPARAALACSEFKARLLNIRNHFVHSNVEALVSAASVDQMQGPVMAPQIH